MSYANNAAFQRHQPSTFAIEPVLLLKPLSVRLFVLVLALTSTLSLVPRARAQATGAVTVLRNLAVTDGATPSAPAPIIRASDGNFYGVISAGGVGDRGTVFRLTPGGQFSVLYAFQSQSEGILPKAIIQGQDGNLYGITRGGGANPTTPAGAGVFFRLTLSGAYTKLYEFDTGAPNEGKFPSALVQGSDGNFYGLTRDGGSVGNYGTFFRLSANGQTRTTLFAFTTGDGPGQSPEAQLIVGSDGNFYGLTNRGGASGGDGGNGSIFQAKMDGTVTKIFTFRGGSTAPGSFLNALVQGSDGALYGTSKQGGARQFGTVFRATLAGSVTLLHEFQDPFVDGISPGGLVQGSNGNFYGNLLEGFGSDPSSLRFGPGGFFEIKTDGTFTLLAKLTPDTATGPSNPVGGLVEIGTNVFASLTGAGGTGGNGTVLSLTVTGSTPVANARLINVATRLRTGTGDDVLIAGFVVGGTGNKRVVIRALGPSLAAAGVPGTLGDPSLGVFNGSGQSVGANDNWGQLSAADQAALAGFNLTPSNGLESALVLSLPPGGYTAIVRGANGTTGNCIVEVYDADTAAPAKLINIATRGPVGTGDNVMIAGFVVQGPGTKRVLIRALGPSLMAAGVPNILADPTLELLSSTASLMSNDDWQETQATEIRATGLAPNSNLESAIFATLQPGAYTAIVRGLNSTSGNALVEVYELP